MKISYNWLRNYLPQAPPVERLAEILTDTGLEVDGVERIGGAELDGVVVGHVLTCTDHPDSDHLHVTTVDVGRGEALQVVCGAATVAAGQRVMVATVGTTLPGDFKIKKSKIRGVESLGMICAEDELGIGTSHDGIMVLAPDAVVGTPAVEHLGLEGDVCIEIGLTPNRVDGASHIGVARDVAAFLNTHGSPTMVEMPSVEGFEVDSHSMGIPVEVEDKQGVIRYAGVTITGLTNRPSPQWMQDYLRAIGLNPHGVLVDITNFVLHELGQPLHAFDAAKIDGGIVVRSGFGGVKFTTLDEVKRTLDGDDLMICDSKKPLCIAGVMGGAESGVGDDTTSVFLESACFDPVRVRKTARRHAINSDASFLFERGVDPDITIYALKRAAMLYKELAGGTISSGVVDIYPAPVPPHRFEFSLSRARRLIGKDIPRDEILRILAALGVSFSGEGDVLQVEVPPYRVDVTREVDLVEEILRIYGYNNIELPSSLHSSLSSAPRPDREKFQWAASEFLTAGGFTETMSNSLSRASYYADSPTLVRLLNPLSQELNAMRQTLLWGALEVVSRNTNHRNGDLKLYEFGNCYFRDPQRQGLAAYSETERLGILMTGLDVRQSWNSKARPADYFALSGVVERLLRRFGFSLKKMAFAAGPGTANFGVSGASGALFDEAATYSLNGRELLTIGSVAGDALRKMDLKTPVYWAEMDFGWFVKCADKVRVRTEELAKFPSVRRDLALVVDVCVTFRALRDIAFATEKKLLTEVELFDVYEGEKIPAGKKSYALSFTLLDRDATLTDRQIDAVMTNLINQYKKQTDAELR